MDILFIILGVLFIAGLSLAIMAGGISERDQIKNMSKK